MKMSLFTDSNEDLEMTAPKFMSIRDIEKLGKETNDKKTIWASKSNWSKVLDQIKGIKNTNTELYAANRILHKENKELMAQNKGLINKNTKLVQDQDKLEQAAKEGLTTTKPNPGAAKAQTHLKAKQRDDIKKQIAWFVKAVLFCTHKFVLPGDDLDKATKIVWEGIKDIFGA